MDQTIENKEIKTDQDLNNKDDTLKILKIANILKDNTFKQFGIIISMGIFIVAIIALLIASYSFFSFNVKASLADFKGDLGNIKDNQTSFVKEIKEIKQNQARFETEIKEIKQNQARFEKEITIKIDKILLKLNIEN